MQNKPKFRVLSRDEAKVRANPSLHDSLPHAQPEPNPNPTPSSSPPKPPRFNPLSFLRARFASLPRPVRLTLRSLKIIAPILPIGLFFSEHVAQFLWVNGPSMTPYLNEDYDNMHTKKDVVLVNMWPFGGAGWGVPWGQRKMLLERGMVVLFRSPGNPHNVAIKRIIGLPGDRIQTREPCIKDSQIVPFNHVWLEGDAADPRRSLDSNTYGPVSISLLSGRVVAVLWPRFRWLDWTTWEKGVVEGDTEGRFGTEYRKETRERVGKEAVELERPFLT